MKANINTLKKELEDVILNDDELTLDDEIEKIDNDIEKLRNKALQYKDKYGDFYDEIKKQINLEIRELAKRKHLKQNDKAIASSLGYKIKKIIDAKLFHLTSLHWMNLISSRYFLERLSKRRIK